MKDAKSELDSLMGSATAMSTAEMDAPADAGRIAALAGHPENGVQLYTASLLVVDPNGKAEAAYLASLAAKPGLAAELVAHLHARAATLQTAA